MLYTLFGLVVFVLDIIAIIDVIGSSADTSKKILWIILIFVLPFLGMALYFLLGRSNSGGRNKA